jgi:TolB protein
MNRRHSTSARRTLGMAQACVLSVALALATVVVHAGGPPHITDLAVLPTPRISWTSASGMCYRVQCSTNLAQPAWQNCADPTVASGNAVQLTDFATEGRLRFFRVREEEGRRDGAYKLRVPVAGSLQNPAWSPDQRFILFTRFTRGYNVEPSHLMVYDLANETVRTLVTNGSANVNLPGSAWNAHTHTIVFSSSREPHDEIFSIHEDGMPGAETQLTSRTNDVAYEPSLSSNGEWVVFESHRLDVETNGVIMKRRTDGTGPYVPLTGSADDCRQPNWSPDDRHIVCQQLANGQWDLWCMDTNGGSRTKVTSGDGDKTDASFGPDGRRIVFSSDLGILSGANLWSIAVTGGIPMRVSVSKGYDGAPSWSPDGMKIVFESYADPAPDGSPGTELWVVPVSH